MRRILNVTKEDLSFSDNGDFIIKNGDIKDTKGTKGLGFLEEVESRIKSSRGDWFFEPEKGANLDSFNGLMITQKTINSLKDSISYSLTFDDFLLSSDFTVSAAVIDVSEVAVKIVFSDNIRNFIDYRIQDVRIMFDFKNTIPRIVRN